MTSQVKYGYSKRREHKNPQLCSLFPIPHDEQFPVMQRMFELASQGASTAQIVCYLQEEFPDIQLRLTISAIDRKLRDSFYCGRWLIRGGTKHERMIDLNKITLADGTRFQPAISSDEFDKIQQIRSGNRNGIMFKNRKRTNPFPALVSCSFCTGQMYPAYRKITVA